MDLTDILAMTDPCRLGECVTREKNDLPIDTPPPGHVFLYAPRD